MLYLGWLVRYVDSVVQTTPVCSKGKQNKMLLPRKENFSFYVYCIIYVYCADEANQNRKLILSICCMGRKHTHTYIYNKYRVKAHLRGKINVISTCPRRIISSALLTLGFTDRTKICVIHYCNIHICIIVNFCCRCSWKERSVGLE